jgi:serine/threonine protein kinase
MTSQTPQEPQQIGGYRILRRLGEGGMGQVFLGTTQSGRQLAIKVIRPEYAEEAEFRRRFQHEIAAAVRVQSPYTAPVIDADPAAAQPWLATAYVQGPSLFEAVTKWGPMPRERLPELILGMARALQAIHGAGVIHRDLKPSNVLMSPEGPKVIDFGIARAFGDTALTSTGLQLGSPQFMSPEQALGRPATPAVDVFALGAVTFFAATGRTPFGEGPGTSVLYRIAHGEPDMQWCPQELRPVIAACLAKDPARRASLSAIIEAFAPGTTSRPPVSDSGTMVMPALTEAAFASSAPPLERRGVPTDRRIMIAIGAGTAVVAAALALAVFATSQQGGAAPHRAGPLATAKTSAGITPAADPSTSPAPTPTPTPTPSGPVLGAQLGTYPNIQLSDGYSINLSPDPQHPSQDGDPGNRQGDLQFVGGKLQAAQLAMVAPGTAAGYVACRDNTAYAPALPVADGTPGNPGLAPGAQVCVTTSSGLIGLLTVAAVQSTPVKYVSFSLTIWQGQPAAQPSDGAQP